MTRYEFTFTGTTSFIFHADDVIKADRVAAERDRMKKVKLPFKAGDDRYPAWTWTTYLYDDGDAIAVPSENLMKCFLEAAKTFPKGKSSYKADSQIAIFIPVEYCEFIGAKGPVRLSTVEKIGKMDFDSMIDAVEPHGFSLYTKRAAVNGAKHVRVRPRFNTWMIRGTLDLDESVISRTTFVEILEYAGDRVGLGDRRPSSPKSPGPNGRFSVKLKKIG